LLNHNRKGTLPREPEVRPPPVPNSPPYDIYHNPMASPLTARDLEYRSPNGLTLPPRKLLTALYGPC
jgi:hypothetical protein